MNEAIMNKLKVNIKDKDTLELQKDGKKVIL
jgi:hypothetical protein